MKALFFILFALLTMPVVASAHDPISCAGYPEKRVFVDSQSWWTTTPGKTGSNFGHVHAGACIPERETLRADTTIDVRLIMHNNPGRFPSGTAHGFSLVAKTTNSETTPVKVPLSGWSCVGTCERWIKVPLRMSFFDRAGLQEVRFRAFIDEPDGQRMIVSMNWQTYIENGKTRSNVSRQPYLRSKGWYTGALYCEAAMKSVPMSDAPLSGVWSPLVSMLRHSSDASLPVTFHSVRLDPDFHAVPENPGTILKQGAGPWEGTVSVNTGMLAPGRHRLVMRSDCNDPRGSTNSGVLVVPFDVG